MEIDSWKRTRGGTEYTIQLQRDEGRIEFDSNDTGGRRKDNPSVIWVEEFPDNDHWQDWVRRNVGAKALSQLQDSIATELEELFATRRRHLDDLYEESCAEYGEGEPTEAIDRIRSFCERWSDLLSEAVPKIADCLAEERAPEVRREAAESLRRLAKSEPNEVAVALDELEPSLRDDEPAVRLESAKAVALIVAGQGDDDELLAAVVDTLVGLLVNETSLFSRGPVAGLLGDIGRGRPDLVEPAVEPLKRFVSGSSDLGSSTSGLGRSTAVEALAEIARADFSLIAPYVDVLFEQLEAPRGSIRRASAHALQFVGIQSAQLAEPSAEALITRLEDKPFVRDEAIESLRRIHDVHPDPVEALLGDRIDLLERPDPLEEVAEAG